MRSFLLVSFILSSLSVNAQPLPSPVSSAGFQAGLNIARSRQQREMCQFLINQFEADRANQVADTEIVRRLRAAFDVPISESVAYDIQEWLRVNRWGGQRPLRGAMENSCDLLMSTSFGRDTADVFRRASAEAAGTLAAEALHSAPLDNEMKNLSRTTTLPAIGPLAQSCELPNGVVCDAETSVTIPGEISTLSDALASRYDPCRCLRERVDRRYPDSEARQRALTDARNSLNNIIVRDAGKKFMDSLASNYEDVNYFKNLPEGRERFSPLYCTNVQELESNLGDGCNVPQSVKQERLHLVFNSLGGISDSSTLSGHMEAFTQRISHMTAPGSTAPYTRDQHDVRRWSLSNTNPNFNGIDTALARMFSTPAIKSRLKADLDADSTRTPEQAIFKVLMDDIEAGNAIPSYLNLAHMEPEKRVEILLALNSGNREELGRVLYGHLSYAMTLHPGIARLLTNRDSFNRLKSSLPADFYTLKGFIESQPTLMAEDLRAECDSLKNKLTELICTPQENIIKSVSPRDLTNIIRTHSPDEASSLRDLNNLLMCENPASGGVSAFSNIKPVETYSTAKNSDYFARVNPELQGRSAFDLIHLAERNNEDIRSEITNAVIRTEENHRGWADHVTNRFHGDSGGRISDETIARVRQSNQSTSSTVATNAAEEQDQVNSETEIEADNTQAVQNLRVPETTINQTGQSNYVNIPTQATTAAREINNGERIEAFRERFDEEEEARLRSNLTPDQLAEIARLREEARKDRAKLDELTNNAQMAKIRMLEEQIRLLEQRRDASIRDTSSVTDTSSSTSDVQTVSSDPQNAVSSSSAALSSQVEALSSLQRPQSAGTAVTSGSSGGASSVGRGIASNPNPTVAAIPRLGSSLSGALVITSTATREGDVPPAELSQEVIRYLTQNNPDLAVLTQIKENGMLYKFRTVENGIEKEREVFIRFDLLTPEARREVEKQIAKRRGENTELSAIQDELTAARRSYSYEALKLIVGQEILRQR